MKNNGIVIFIIIILAIIAGFFLFNSFLKKDIINKEAIVQSAKSQPIASLVVPQQVSSTSVFIQKVYLPKGGYVVIHKNDNDKLGDVIGVSKLLKSGANDNFLINISKKTKSGDRLFAVLHKDDGDDVFNPLVDLPAVGIDGKQIIVGFGIVNEGALDSEVKL